MSEAAALLVLAVSLVSAVARPRWAPDWAVAGVGAVLLVLAGVISLGGARSALGDLAPTVAFLAALLLLADGCARAGLFAALGAVMARGARGGAPRLLAMVFVCGGATTAVLSLDATVVLLTPIVIVTAARLRAPARPHIYACVHLANSASLLLPISNLTNLLAFRASGLSFTRFAALMTLPWLVAVGVEWVVLRWWFADELPYAVRGTPVAGPEAALPRYATGVLAATLIGFAISSTVGVAPVWVAVAGALALAVARRPPLGAAIAAAQPGFLVFVLALGVIVQAASARGLAHTIDGLLPHSLGLPALCAIAGVSALSANLLNNLPATLVLLPVVARTGAGAVLAMLIGVGVGPNLTYVGSLATLLWRRVVRAHGERTDAGEFLRLGLVSVPPALLGATVALWLALRWLGTA